MKYVPKALQSAINALSKLPGVGPRSAERYAYFLFKQDPRFSVDIAEALKVLHQNVSLCPTTHVLINKGEEFSPLYTDPSRDKTLVAVVAEPFDAIALEKASVFRGTYHSLGGLLSPIDGISEDSLNITSLLNRIETDAVSEIILATNSSVEGESTALYIQRLVNDSYPDVVVTRLARGLPMGTDLEYADHVTLGRAFEHRQHF